MITRSFDQFPYAAEQRIISEGQGILAHEQGISLAKPDITIGALQINICLFMQTAAQQPCRGPFG